MLGRGAAAGRSQREAMPQSGKPPNVGGNEAEQLIEGARSSAGAYLAGSVATVMTLVLVAIVTQLLVDDPRARADAFASTVHYFNQLEDNARAEFALAADDQRDATENLIHAMMDGAPPSEIRARAETMKSKVEAYERAGARLEALEDNYGPVFNSDSRTPEYRELGAQLMALHAYERDAMAAAGRFKVCLQRAVERYLSAPAVTGGNPLQLRCKRSGVVFLLFDRTGAANGEADDEEKGELGRLDECEYGIEVRLNYIAASLSVAVESRDGADTILSRTADGVRGLFAGPRRVLSPVKPPRETMAESCGGAADDTHHAMLPVADNLGPWQEADFHPFSGAGGEVQSAAAPAGDGPPPSVQPAALHE